MLHFTELEAWKTAHQLAITIYRLTEKYPKAELFGLTSQMRRCAVSIGSNIAEGFGRQSIREKIQFYFIAQGSDTELQNQLLLSRDVGYITKEKCQEVFDQTIRLHKLVTGLIKSSRNRLA